MKKKHLFLIIGALVVLIVILILLYTCQTCHPLPSVPALTETTREQTQDNEPAQARPSSVPPETPRRTVSAPPVKKEPEKAAPSPAIEQTKTPTPIKTDETKPAPPSAKYAFLAEWNGHRYFVSSEAAAWHDASAACAAYGAHLVTITSSDENKAIIQGLKILGIEEDLWIGLSDEKWEGRWEWVTGEATDFTYWDERQPDNKNGREDSAGIRLKQSSSSPITRFRWNDANPAGTIRFILEIE